MTVIVHEKRGSFPSSTRRGALPSSHNPFQMVPTLSVGSGMESDLPRFLVVIVVFAMYEECAP